MKESNLLIGDTKIGKFPEEDHQQDFQFNTTKEITP